MGCRAPRAAEARRFALLLLALIPAAAASATRAVPDIYQLSIEELAQIEISSVSRRPERLDDSAAAVYVITREQIRRSGVTSLPEALRLAPNLQVARVTSNSWAITARGFNGESANKLLVMIDGRSVYTPLHSGVFWDAQDTLLADIDRIEVVSGPGGTLWGANAVNGVINIVTRSARDTVGTLVEAVAGSDDKGLSLRHGVRRGDTAVRGYARRFVHDGTERADGSPVRDAWSHGQGGFRADGASAGAAWTLQGDAYEGSAQVPGLPDRRTLGANLLGRWSRDRADGGWQVQAYFDTYSRKQPGFFTEQLDTFDVDVQQRLRWGGRHELVWGGGWREQQDRTTGGALIAFTPPDSRLRLVNVFAQDTVALRERVKLTLGLKLERNSFSGLEVQPNLRIAWRRDGQSLLWAAVSRAVRTPSRLDRDLQTLVPLPPPYGGRLLGGSQFKSERVTATELGMRGQPSERLSYSVNVFYQQYGRLRSVEPQGAGFVIGNGVEGHATGLESWGSWQVNEAWRLAAGWTLLSQHLRFDPGSHDPGSPTAGANDPRHQLQLRASWNGPRRWAFDVGLRQVGALPEPAVPAYTAVDARLAWNPRPDLELSLSGFNLFDARHPEFGPAPSRSELGRRIVLRASWSR